MVVLDSPINCFPQPHSHPFFQTLSPKSLNMLNPNYQTLLLNSLHLVDRLVNYASFHPIIGFNEFLPQHMDKLH